MKPRDLMAPDTEPTDEELEAAMRDALDIAIQRRALSDAWIAARLEEATRFAREHGLPRSHAEPAIDDPASAARGRRNNALTAPTGGAQVWAMTVELPEKVEEKLRTLAKRQNRSIDLLIKEAVEQYIEVAAITDTTPGEVATTQEVLLGELTDTPEWREERP